MKENTLLLRRNSVQNFFNGYYYDSSIAAIAGSKLSSIQPIQPIIQDKAEGNSRMIAWANIDIEDQKKVTKNVDTSEITTKDLVSKN